MFLLSGVSLEDLTKKITPKTDVGEKNRTSRATDAVKNPLMMTQV